MKKIGQSKIVNLVVSLVIAILLAAYVSSTKQGTATNSGGSTNFSTLIPEKRATLKVPLNLQVDSDKYVVIGAPSTVKVGIEGSGPLVTAAQSHNDIQASVDLRSLGVGKHNVKVALRGVNSSLTSTVTPQTVTVTISQKKSAKLPVQVSFDKSKIATEYAVGDTTSDPKNVTISGPKANVEAVSYVDANVSLDSGVKQSVSQSVKLVARDKDGNAVEVNFSDPTANVTLDIEPEDSKKMNLSATINNGDSDDYTITFDPKTVTAYGSSDILKSVDTINIPVDVADISNKTTRTIEIPTQTGIVEYSVSKVKVTITPSNTSSTSSSSTGSTSSRSSSSSSSSSESTSSSTQSSASTTSETKGQ
ncbi:YbbR-like domain-containing protein [Leuconostoc suionicum]|uniref:CdaR family protein n=1 Tax=Leuconostoc suionicum TaxID=1511761 RepID=UPI00233F0D72|nr:CdaR family protein [Leuconostoc suionicum]MDC2806750.1 CdaR family protein [Leuconostoc suionicum]MDC2824262.1 CdaR family protein [Leuconostoc suionicum]